MGWMTKKVVTEPNGDMHRLEMNYLCKGVAEYYHLKNGNLTFLSHDYNDAVKRFEQITD